MILFGPIGGVSAQQIVDGLPMWGNPMPWKKTSADAEHRPHRFHDDIRPGLGEQGLANLKRFVAMAAC